MKAKSTKQTSPKLHLRIGLQVPDDVVAVITGGLGFIGGNLAKDLVAMGWKVHVIDNCANSKPEDLAPGATLKIMDIRDGSAMTEYFKFVKPDYVFHTAALPRVQYSIKNPNETNDVNVTGTLNTLIAAQECGTVKKFVYSASSSAYGDQKIMPLTENMDPNPQSPYGAQKYMGEVYCKVWNKVFGLPTVSLRYFNVYGPGQKDDGAYALVIAKFFKQVREGQPLTITGDGKQTRDFTYVHDVVVANILAALCSDPEASDGGVFNIGFGSNQPVNRIANLVAGEEYPKEYIEARLEPKDTLASNFKAMAVLGWVPRVDIKRGITVLKDLESGVK